MIELQKRYNVFQRRLPVIVIDTLTDPDASKSTLWLMEHFGKEEYLNICDKINKTCEEGNPKYWIVIEENSLNYYLYSSFDDIIKDYCNYFMFDENDKSSFPYWFAHWCSFQLCALNLGLWKFKYIFHDFEKPWLKLFWSYKKVQKWHREHNKHHLEYGLKHGWNKVDWYALMIDWECSHMSKKQCPLNAREEMENKLSEEKWKPYEKEIRKYLESILNSYFM